MSTVLAMSGIRKAFGPVQALDGVDLQVQEQEILGLLGGNGAGKTTLMNVLYGLYRPDEGHIAVRGQPVEINSPKDALAHGIGMVHQHFLQVPSFTVAENIVLGLPLRNRPRLDLAAEEHKIRDLAVRFGLDVDPRARIERLPMGMRQRVEILKALYRGVRILILDEPTTNLTPQQVEALFASLQAMVEQGLSVIFITHKLREVMAACGRIAVLRHGRNVLTVARQEAAEPALVQAMVGEELDVERSLLFAGPAGTLAPLAARPAAGQPVLKVEALRIAGPDGLDRIAGCTFAVAPGEIFGIAGVAGNGQIELVEGLLGLLPIAGGRAEIGGLAAGAGMTEALLAGGVAYVPESKWIDGVLPSASVAHNLILGAQRHGTYVNGPWLNWRAIRRVSGQLIDQFAIKTQGPDDPAANLSGGNIQRLLLARALSQARTLLIAHNPTQGLDIPSMEFTYRRFLARSGEGLAILLLSEDLDELFLLCQRIAVLYRGRIAGLLEREAFDKYRVGQLMSGAAEAQVAA
jgi:simple sugar transport system ATP-binding protein